MSTPREQGQEIVFSWSDKVFGVLFSGAIFSVIVLGLSGNLPPPPPPESRIRIDSEVLSTAVKLIQLHGWKCDTVDAALPFIFFGRGFTVTCNGYRYTYEIEDVGGKWEVNVQ